MVRKNKVFLGVFIALFILAAAASVTMGVLFGKETANAAGYRSRMGTVYENTYYEMTDNMIDVERKLGKVAVLSRPTLQQEYLYDIWRQCSVVVSLLSRMTEENNDTEAVVGFLNKTGDYCYYLSRKAQKDPPSQEELANLERFKKIVSELNESFFSVREKTEDGDRIDPTVLLDMKTVGEAVKNRSDVEYPELIYDGPFSDGLKKREAVFLKDKEEIAEEKGVEKIKDFFTGAEDVKTTGENSGTIPAYVYKFSFGGRECTAQITKAGGYLSEYSVYEKVTDPQYTPEETKTLAGRFLAAIGYEDMECVWVYNSDSTVYLNFAATQNGVVLYADLIKVKVSAETGDILGVEAQNYIYNHRLRTVDPSRTEVSVSPKITVENRRECVIPTEWGTEIRCLEVSGRFQGEKYYVYYDSATGEEIEAFVVVDDLLM